MKHWHKILAVALLISATCLTGCEAKTEESSRNRVSILPWVGWQRESKETRFLKSAETAPISEAALPVVLPEKAEAILREGTAKQGQLSRVSAEQLILALAGQEISVPIKDVTEVKFTGEVRFKSNGKLVVRGEDDQKSEAEDWPNIPLVAFQVVEGTTGQATVNLTQSALAKAKQQGIVTVANTATYMVEKMQFEPEGKVTLTVKPITAKE